MKLFDYCYYEDFGSEYYIQLLSFYPKFAFIDMCIQWDQYTPDDWIPSLNINIGPCSIGFSFRWRKLGIRFNALDFDPSDLASYRRWSSNDHRSKA